MHILLQALFDSPKTWKSCCNVTALCRTSQWPHSMAFSWSWIVRSTWEWVLLCSRMFVLGFSMKVVKFSDSNGVQWLLYCDLQCPYHLCTHLPPYVPFLGHKAMSFMPATHPVRCTVCNVLLCTDTQHPCCHSIALNGFQLYIHDDSCNAYGYSDVHEDSEVTKPKYQ